jgi:hypothetical protein
VEEKGIRIVHRDGTAFLAVSELPLESQQQIYDVEADVDNVQPSPDQARLVELVTLEGTVYRDVTVTRIERTGIRITHRDGLGFVDFNSLPASVRDRFGYTAARYAAGKVAKQRQQQISQTAQRQAEVQAAANHAKELEARQAASNAYQQALLRASQVPAASPTIADRNYADTDYSSRGYETNRYARPSYSGGSVQVRGYFRKDGTYVRPHTRRK